MGFLTTIKTTVTYSESEHLISGHLPVTIERTT